MENLKGKEFTRLSKSEIVDFKHGIDGIVWFEFTIGRRYSITFKDKRNKEIKIQFSSHFGRHEISNQKYSDIVGDIWRLYHCSIVDNYLEAFYNLAEIEIQGIKLKNEGIGLRGEKGLVALGQGDNQGLL